MNKLIKLMAAAVIALMPAAAAAQDKNNVVIDTNPVQETATPALPDSIIRKINRLDQVEKANDPELELLKKRNLELLENLVTLATNFLYVPYDRFSIDKIALRAFEKAESITVYEDHKQELDMLTNYRADIESIVSFLDSINKGSFALKMGGGKNEAQRKAADLDKLAVTKRYKESNADMYIPKKLKAIRAVLNETNSNAFNKLREIKAELEGLLKDQ